MLGSPAPVMSHWLEGFPVSAFSAAISFGPTERVRTCVALCGPAVTLTVTVDTPLAVGVPEITPVAAASVRPAGSDPFVIDHEYGGVPPTTDSVVEYAVFTTPTGRLVVVITGPPGGRTVRVVLPLSSPIAPEIVVVPSLTAVAPPVAVPVATAAPGELHGPSAAR